MRRKSAKAPSAATAKPPVEWSLGPLTIRWGRPEEAPKPEPRPRPSAPRVFIVSIIKNEARDLSEWLSFHIAVGFDHFVLYDNQSTDETRQILAPYIQEGLVTLIDWPKPTGQLPCYIHAFGMFGKAADWFCIIDADEFVIPKKHGRIQDYVSTFSASQIYLPWRSIGFSGHRRRPEGLLIENFTIAEKLAIRPGTTVHTKVLIRPEAAKLIGAHGCLLHEGHETVNWEGEPAKPADFPAYRPYDSIQINHYYYKSYEEFEAKIQRGSATGALVKRLVPFEALDKNYGDVEEAALRFADKTRANMAYFAGAPKKYLRYGRRFSNRGEKRGSQPYFCDLHDFNPLRWFLTRAISNFIHEREQVEFNYVKLKADGLGDRYVLPLGQQSVPEGSWTDSVHFRHFCELSGSDWMPEITASPKTGGVSITPPDSEGVYCYTSIVHCHCSDPTDASLQVTGHPASGPPTKHRFTLGQGENIVVCEHADEPRVFERLEHLAVGSCQIKRVSAVRYA